MSPMTIRQILERVKDESDVFCSQCNSRKTYNDYLYICVGGVEKALCLNGLHDMHLIDFVPRVD